MQPEPKQTTQPFERRATDQQQPTNAELWKLLIDIRDRMAALESVHQSQAEAFVKDDLGKPDYHGHRKAHNGMIKAAEVMDGYKIEAAKKVIGILVAFIMGVAASGVVEAFRAPLKPAPVASVPK